MKARIFKTGDKVRHKNGAEVMTVEKYATNYRPLLGWEESDFLVICVWKGDGRFHKEIIHQSNLIEVEDKFTFGNYDYMSYKEQFRSSANRNI